jgi:hypothetical protein
MRKVYRLILLAAALWLTACWPRSTATPTLVPTRPATLPPSGPPIPFAELVNVVETRPSEAGVFVLAGLGQKIGTGAQVRTGDVSFARLDLEQGGAMRLAPKSLITILALPMTADEPLARLRLSNGKIWISLKAGGVEVETPAGVAALRGAYGEFEYWPGAPNDPADDVMVVRCLEGVCGVQEPTGGPLIVLGRMELLTVTTNNQPPARATLGLEAIAEFVQNNPAHADLEAILTAGAPSETPTPTPTLTASASATTTRTPTVTATRTFTRTATRTRTPGTLTPTRTSTAATATPTKTSTPSVTMTPSRSLTPSISPTRTHTPQATATRTQTVSTPSRTPTVTVMMSPTSTGTGTVTFTPTPTSPPVPTSTPTETLISLPTQTPTETPLPPTVTATGTDTPAPTATGTDVPVPTATTTATP